jgi:DNA-binding MarR family transcriptional regulator
VTLRQEYNKAKSIVNDIILSVGNQFRRQKESILFVEHQVKDFIKENKEITKKVIETDGRLSDLNRFIKNVPRIEDIFTEQVKEIRTEIYNIKNTQNSIMKKIVKFEKMKQRTSVPEVKIKAAIPIKKEKVLEPLTDTELKVLETIGKEGEKTAPEIKEKIELTREHTARLMKKLYKNGYLERDTHKMPYVYRLKEEMKKILKKREYGSL